MAMENQPSAMNKGGEPQGPEVFVAEMAESALLVSSAKNNRKDFLCQPSVQKAQLMLVQHMFQIVIDNGDVTNSILDCLSC